MSKVGRRGLVWILSVALIAANGAMTGVLFQKAGAEELSGCSSTPHCHCFDDGSEIPWCSHVMGSGDYCKWNSDCEGGGI